MLIALVPLVGCGGEDPAAAVRDPLLDDPRLTLLLEPCLRGGHYDRNTNEVVEILVEKLMFAHPEQMRRAKEQLAEMGDAAVPALARMIQRWYDDPTSFAHVQNALEALSMGDARTAHDPILQCIEHPTDTVRMHSLRALAAGHARKVDYDRIFYRLQHETYDLQRTAALGLFAADRERAEQQVAEWLEKDMAKELWPDLLPLTAESQDPGVLARLSALQVSEWPQIRLWGTAVAAANGDLEADIRLRRVLEDGELNERTIAVQAVVQLGLIDLLSEVLRDDPAAALRLMAIDAVAQRAGEEPYRSWLTAAVNDPDQGVRERVLKVLIRAEDQVALDRVLALLEGRAAHLQQAVTILSSSLEEESEAARRAFEILVRLDGQNDHLPLGGRNSVLQAIGLVPLGDAAEYLRDVGLAAELEGQPLTQGMRPHRWTTLSAANTGLSGRRRLMELLPTESDPARRIDLLWAVSSRRDALTRELLIPHVEDPATAPLEVLFCAERLANTGPIDVMAPLLKRVTLTVTDPLVRPALECLLWRWF